MEQITAEQGKAYYFSHETITKLESGAISFVDADGTELRPSYFGAGLHGMNGTLTPSHKE